jgi:hypothetical protein
MLLPRLIVRSMVLGVALCLLTVSGSSRAEPTALDDAPPSKEEKPATDKPGRNFSATLEANLLSGDDIVAKAGTQVYGQVIGSKKVGRCIRSRRAASLRARRA